MSTAPSRTEPPWRELDPGVVPIVRFLWNAGFEPTDSGDGSKAAWMEEALPFPHVAVAAPPEKLLQEADRAAALPWPVPPTDIEATYFPLSGHAIILLSWQATEGSPE